MGVRWNHQRGSRNLIPIGSRWYVSYHSLINCYILKCSCYFKDYKTVYSYLNFKLSKTCELRNIIKDYKTVYSYLNFKEQYYIWTLNVIRTPNCLDVEVIQGERILPIHEYVISAEDYVDTRVWRHENPREFCTYLNVSWSNFKMI